MKTYITEAAIKNIVMECVKRILKEDYIDYEDGEEEIENLIKIVKEKLNPVGLDLDGGMDVLQNRENLEVVDLEGRLVVSHDDYDRLKDSNPGKVVIATPEQEAVLNKIKPMLYKIWNI